MGYNINITDANTGQGITNATIVCSCDVRNEGGGLYYVDASITSTPVVTAPGYYPSVIGWWAALFGGGIGMSKLSNPIPGSTSEDEATKNEKW